MKKEDLIGLGIEEETAKKIMALHGTTVTQLNSKISSVEAERDGLQEQIATNQKELTALQESAKGNEDLSKQLSELQEKLTQAEADAKTKLEGQKKDFAIQLALREAKALDENIVLSLLDRDTIKVTDGGIQGLDEQVKSLKEEKAFLFASDQETPSAGKPRVTADGNPNPSITPNEDGMIDDALKRHGYTNN